MNSPTFNPWFLYMKMRRGVHGSIRDFRGIFWSIHEILETSEGRGPSTGSSATNGGCVSRERETVVVSGNERPKESV